METRVSRIEFRPIAATDESFLWEMLYQAIYTPPGSPPPGREILQEPDISRYVSGWGRAGDMGLIADVAGRSAGAAWLRLWEGAARGYGYIASDIPELSVALSPEYRGRGIGTTLLNALLEQAAVKYRAVSLSVAAASAAVRLYQRLGFRIYAESRDGLTMVREFGGA